MANLIGDGGLRVSLSTVEEDEQMTRRGGRVIF
jgi:hypothetical protein